MSSVFQWPYREARDGYWGIQSSTLNWCEEVRPLHHWWTHTLTRDQDYNITPYIAEFFNTVTNITFMYLGFLGIRHCLRYGVAKVYLVAFAGYIIIGLGSMAFHASLKCWWIAYLALHTSHLSIC